MTNPQQPEQPPNPEAPRTFATALRDNISMTPEMAARLLALDDGGQSPGGPSPGGQSAGRHPTLTEMRRALGLDLVLDSPWNPRAFERRFALLDPMSSDEELAERLDGLYRSIESTRLVRAEISDGGIRAVRAHEPIVIRQGEELSILVMADSQRDTGSEFSAELHGEGFGGWVEARRTGSSLIHAGPVPVGSYLMPMLLVADGRPHTVDLPIECAAAGTLRVRIIDDATDTEVAARVVLTDGCGPAWPRDAIFRRDEHGDAWFHANGGFSAIVAGKARVRIVRGMEYEPFETEIDVPVEGVATLTARLTRWSHMQADGWHSGDVHVHLHYGGEWLLTPDDAALMQRAEDAHFVNMAVANQGSGVVHDESHFTGNPHASSGEHHQLQWGEEYRNNFYGHMCMFGLGALVPPIYCGFRPSEHPHDLPSNAGAARLAREHGGGVSYAHPLFGHGALDRVFMYSHTVEAKELPVDAALGLIDAVDVMSYPGADVEVTRLWYRLLNCGLRLAATAGTDTFFNTCDAGEFSNPPAGNRAFVRIDGPLSAGAWRDGVRAGRTFVTNGPMLALTADGREIGDEIAAKAGETLVVEAEAGSHAPFDRLELIVNGDVVATAPATDGGTTAALRYELAVVESCWVAARASGSESRLVYGGPVYAHTSPIYVTVGGSPVANAEDAAYFVEWTERLIAMTLEKGHYPDERSRDEVVATFREGQAVFGRMVAGD